ncbi:Electron transfer flavoprotein small subunit [Raoultella ornithinolytica]|nr:Electron transfer flavoprotein, beta subunit [Raoultella ornithinolytica]SBL97056.1 Electron transfer flavoprotein small subunit [Raoultella ornithinolytica]VTM88967.1 Electron transfer flavoprotein small subunit [Raoultella ornithinolytica]VTN61191.1 Electron transfer flavoprotein small subunit [Raoultella ornithinolytica]
MKILVGVCEASEWDEARVCAVVREGKLEDFCAVALEQALRIKEQLGEGQILAFAMGLSPEALLRQALALGADRALGMKVATACEPLAVAKQIASLAQQEQVDLVLLGKQTADWQGGAMVGMVAGMLDWPQIQPVSGLQWQQGQLHLQCYGEQYQLHSVTQPPVVLGLELGLAEPRFASLPAILRSRRQELEWLAPPDEPRATQAYLSLEPQNASRKAQQLHSVDELVELLNHKVEINWTR